MACVSRIRGAASDDLEIDPSRASGRASARLRRPLALAENQAFGIEQSAKRRGVYSLSTNRLLSV